MATGIEILVFSFEGNKTDGSVGVSAETDRGSYEELFDSKAALIEQVPSEDALKRRVFESPQMKGHRSAIQCDEFGPDVAQSIEVIGWDQHIGA